ncbi:hypothetical protein FC093_21210 [Ilyomonas limi]|uniref:EpsG family protein n=1 Tax=Ilyomonas limi TaxID=2575867 RepID=A0A4U3KRI6_9BACT|nr:hypothetical protein [Ilyomonas limi]TKK65025.1 hypothetical protein FC093_21210 [Ilyomonas limi]
MIGAFILLIILYALTQPLLKVFKSKYRWFDMDLMQKLFWYHVFFALVYYVTVMNSRSDSVSYFERPQYAYSSWWEAFQTGTLFIEFVGYPFINFFHFSYEMMMLLFSWMGFWGFVYFYIFFKENVKYKHYYEGYDLIMLFMFLPNMHYWTASLGKGSIIFFGMGMATYGLSKLKGRKLALIAGLAIVYYVRPHIFLFMGIAILVGLFTGKQDVPKYQKWLVLIGAAVALTLMYNTIISFVGLDSDNLVGSFDQFSSTRAYELSSANSGIDISNYPLIFKLFTFWYRPLFIDSPGFTGIVVSIENVFYLLLSYKLWEKGFLKFFKVSSSLVKMSAVLFIGTSLALGETLSNMGIIVRQKSMVMYYLLFIIITYLDYKKGLVASKKKNAADLQLAASPQN